MLLLNYRTIVLVLLWQLRFFVKAQDECKNDTFPVGSYCEDVYTWEDFAAWVDDSVPGDELYLCPFDIEKGDQPSLTISWGLAIICVRTNVTDSCTIQGSGILIDVQTSEDTLFQGLDFADGDDHAVHISSLDGNSSAVTRNFCFCTFTGIKRLSTARGGALMTQNNAGIVNLFYCYFADNYSATRGAAIYTRTNQLNVVGCRFIDNSALEWGGAIFCAAEGNMYVEGSTFVRDNGLDDYGVVVKPREGTSVWVDGGDNMLTGGPCTGFYLLADNICQPYIGSPDATPLPTAQPSQSLSPPSQSLSPSAAPTSDADQLCQFEEDDLPCIEVDTFADMQAAILASNSVTFCGGFNLEKATDEVLELSGEHDIRCTRTCTLSGDGTHIEVTGSDSQVRVHNMKFMLSDSSAVQIRTSAANSTATTTLCKTEFWRNTAQFGAAISIARNAGKVNVVDSSFTNNEAVRGGAIYGGAEKLCIFNSVFVNNVAKEAGSAIFTYFESDVVVQSSYFALNNVVSSDNYVVVVKAGEDNQSDLEGTFIDAGKNSVVSSGSCKGYFVQPLQACRQFGNRPSDNGDDEISVAAVGTDPAA